MLMGWFNLGAMRAEIKLVTIPALEAVWRVLKLLVVFYRVGNKFFAALVANKDRSFWFRKILK